MKKLLSTVLTVALCLAMMPVTMAASSAWTLTTVVAPKYENVGELCEGMAAVCVKSGNEEQWGFIDIDGREVVPCQYYSVEPFSEGMAAVCRKIMVKESWGMVADYCWGYIDKTGKEVIPCQYVRAAYFSDGLARVREKDDGIAKSTYIDKTGKVVIPAKYTFDDHDAQNYPDHDPDRTYAVEPGDFFNGYAEVYLGASGFNTAQNAKWGIIDKTGREIIPCIYSGRFIFSEGLAAVKVATGEERVWGPVTKSGYIDETGRMVIPVQYDGAGKFKNGYAPVKIDGKWGCIDRTGKLIIPCQYQETFNFTKDNDGKLVAEVRQNSRDFYIDISGRELTDYKSAGFDFAIKASEGIQRVGFNVGGFIGDVEYGYLDEQGEVIVWPKYDMAEDFSEGLAAVRMPGEEELWTYIDKTGKEVFPREYRYADDFSGGVAIVATGDNWEINSRRYGIIDKSGQKVVPCQYEGLQKVKDGLYLFKQGGKWGLMYAMPQGSGFIDVNKDDYFATPVQWAVEKKITAGTSAATFSPNDKCTVAQILTFLWRANGSPRPTGSNPFSDVRTGDYYADAAVWAYEKGMVSGGVFNGNAPCTRGMAVIYMWKAAGSPEANAAGFTDVPTGADYAVAVAWAVEKGVTTGTSPTTFSPDNTCTRGQIVTFLYRGLAK